MKVGVLALQGDFDAHKTRLDQLGASTLLVRKASEIQAISGLVLPGGESTAMLRLMDQAMRSRLYQAIAGGLPVLATCAGVILLAKEVLNPAQESLDLLDATVERNSYGRQIHSFVASNLHWSTSGKELISSLEGAALTPLEGVFIRAPRITKIGAAVTTLVSHDSEPVLVKQNKLLAATFHPELSSSGHVVHQLFLSLL